MEDTTQRLQEAIKAAREGRLVEARGIAEELAEADPQNAHAWYLRGVLAEDEGQQLEYLSRALEIDPEHQPARKRMAQLQPPVEEEAQPEVQATGESEVEEAEEAAEDMTVVAEAAAFESAVADESPTEETPEGFFEQPPAEAELDESAAEATFEETMIAEAPFTEEMAAEDIQVEALFGDEAEDEQEAEEDDMATVIAAAAFLGDEEVADEGAVQETDEGELKASDLAAAAAGAAALDQAGEAWFDDEAGDELWSKVEAEAVPDWLIEDTADEVDVTQEGEPLEDAFAAADVQATKEQDLPDWLLDEPDEDWTEAEAVVDESDFFEEAPETVVTAAVVAGEQVEDEEALEPVEEEMEEAEEEVAPAQPKKKPSATRSLEIALVLLIIVAVVIVGALVYFLINPPF
jgi:hypothetical protein